MMLSTTVLLFAAVAEPVFAEDGGFGGRYESILNGSAKSERVDAGMSNTGNVGTRNSEMTEPGDLAVTGGLSDGSRA